MYYSAHLALLCVIFAYYQGLYDITMISALVLCCSINYWRHPTFGYRRTMDIICAQFALWYNFYLTYAFLSYQLFLIHSFGIFLFAMSYFTAIYFGVHGNQNYASFCHVMLHIIAVIFNLMLSYNLNKALPKSVGFNA